MEMVTKPYIGAIGKLLPANLRTMSYLPAFYLVRTVQSSLVKVKIERAQARLAL